MVKFERGGNDNGTFYVGLFKAPYSKVVEVFGEPEEGGDKVAFVWVITFTDEDDIQDVATIYDWKETSVYDDNLPHPNTLKTREYVEWHIGGHSSHAASLVLQALGVN